MGILGRHYLHTVATNFVLKFVVGLAIGVATARALGPAGCGEYNLLVLIITTVTTLFNFGIPGTNTYFMAQKRFSRAQLTHASIVLTIPISILGFAILYLLFELHLFNFLFPTDKLTPPIIASLSIIPIVLFNLFAQGIIVGENRIALNNYITLSSQGALAIALLILFAMQALTVTLAIVLYAASYLFALVFIVVASFPPVHEVIHSKLTGSDYRQLLGFSATIHIGNLTQFFNYRLDSFIVNFFLGVAAVGLYRFSATFAETLWLLSASMAAVLLPTLAGQHEKSKEIALKATVATFGVSFIAGIGAFLVAPPVIVFLLGKAFEGSVAPFLILVPGIVVFSLTNILATYLTGVGRPGYNAVIAFISFLFTVIFDILLIPRYGIPGAAIASVISYSVSSLMTLIVFWKVSRMTGAESVLIVKSMSADIRSIVTRTRGRLGLDKNSSGTTGTK